MKKKGLQHGLIEKNHFFQIVLGPSREVHTGPGSVSRPVSSSLKAQNEDKLRSQKSFFFLLGTSKYYYQVKASSNFTLPGPKTEQNYTTTPDQPQSGRYSYKF